MSLKKNIIANYASQLYVAGIGILILPLYIKYMGAEAYGLVGFFTMLQAFFAMLDLGLTPTISRQSARYHGGALNPLEYKQLHRALSVIFFTMAVIGGGLLFFASGYISNSWLNIEQLNLVEVNLAVKIMAVSVALRWLCGLYRGVITGAEKLVWLSFYNITIATLRFVVVLPVMWWLGATPTVFFIYQLMVAVLELFIIYFKSSFLLPSKKEISGEIGWSFKPVKSVLKFSLTIAFTSSVWVLITQTDKLILSGILSLTDYGYFTLAVMLAAGIMLLASPITAAVMPRMARLHAEGKQIELINTYKNATQLVAVIAGAATITIISCAYNIIFAWTGDELLAAKAAPILKLYAAGYGLLSIGAFPYYLQYAKGNLRYHLIGNIILLLLLFPALIIIAKEYGAIGAGWVWLSVNAIYLVFWVGYVHSKLEPGLHFKWLFQDIFLILILPVVTILYINKYIMIASDNGRLMQIGAVLFIGFIALFLAAASSSYIRDFFSKKVLKKQ